MHFMIEFINVVKSCAKIRSKSFYFKLTNCSDIFVHISHFRDNLQADYTFQTLKRVSGLKQSDLYFLLLIKDY